MILLKLSIYFIMISFAFVILGKQDCKKWNIYDYFFFSFCILIAFYIMEDSYSYPLLLLLISGLWITKLLIEELFQLKNFQKKKAVVVIKNGVLNFKELTKLSYSFDKLMQDLEKIGIKNVDEVGFAILKDKKLMCIKK